MSFKIGDVVRHKCGGKKMTINRVLKNGRVECVWFEDTSLLKKTFLPDALERDLPSPLGEAPPLLVH